MLTVITQPFQIVQKQEFDEFLERAEQNGDRELVEWKIKQLVENFENRDNLAIFVERENHLGFAYQRFNEDGTFNTFYFIMMVYDAEDHSVSSHS